MAAKKINPTTNGASQRKKQLDRLLSNLRKNADAEDIEAIVVSVVLKPTGVYPNDGQMDADAGGYTAGIDLGHGQEEDDDMVGIQATAMTRGLAVCVHQKLIQKSSGMFG